VNVLRAVILSESNQDSSSSIIEHFKKTGNPIGFFYFDFRQQTQTLYSRFLASLILQLTHYPGSTALPASLRELYQNHGMEPTVSELECALHSICDCLRHPYIILDAYDECPHLLQHSVLYLIQALVERNARVLVFTRPGLCMGIRPVLRNSAKYFVDLEGEKLNLENDIQKYLGRRLEWDPEFCRWDREASQIIMEQLAADFSKG
jgi:hypothetical protein